MRFIEDECGEVIVYCEGCSSYRHLDEVTKISIGALCKDCYNEFRNDPDSDFYNDVWETLFEPMSDDYYDRNGIFIGELGPQ